MFLFELILIDCYAKKQWFIGTLLNAQFVEHPDETLVEALVGTDALREGYIHNLVHAIAYHDVSLSLLDSIDSTNAHTTGKDAVASGRRTTTLQVPKDGDTYIECGELMFYTVGIVEGATLGTLGNDDDT